MTKQNYLSRPSFHTLLLLAGMSLGFRGCFINREDDNKPPNVQRRAIWTLDGIIAKFKNVPEDEGTFKKLMAVLEDFEAFFSKLVGGELEQEEGREYARFFKRHWREILSFLECMSTYDQNQFAEAIADMPGSYSVQDVRGLLSAFKKGLTRGGKYWDDLEKKTYTDSLDQEVVDVPTEWNAFSRVRDLDKWRELFGTISVDESAQKRVMWAIMSVEDQQKKVVKKKEKLYPNKLVALMKEAKADENVKGLLERMNERLNAYELKTAVGAFSRLAMSNKGLLMRQLRQGKSISTVDMALVWSIVESDELRVLKRLQ